VRSLHRREAGAGAECGRAEAGLRECVDEERLARISHRLRSFVSAFRLWGATRGRCISPVRAVRTLKTARRTGFALVAATALLLPGASSPALAAPANADPGAGLQFITSFQGLLDTADGWSGSAGNAPYAEPSIAHAAHPQYPSSDELEQTANSNFAQTFNPRQGPDADLKNFGSRLWDQLGSGVPPIGLQTEPAAAST